MYNLTETQKIIAKWLVQSVRDKKLEEEFTIYWIETFETSSPQAVLFDWRGTKDELKEVDLSQGALNALKANDLLYIENISKNWKCTLTGKIYEAVDKDFNAPDTSFLKYLSPLTDISGFDKELKQRCLPILSAGGFRSYVVGFCCKNSRSNFRRKVT